MTGIFIDPGPEQSAWLVFDGQRVLAMAIDDNPTLLQSLKNSDMAVADILVIEQVTSFGMAVGAEVFETVFWSGRFAQAWGRDFDRLKRHVVKQTLCGNQQAKDPNIRAALLDRFGPGREKAMGTKKCPGPLYGVANDLWSALALGVTWFEVRAAAWPVAVQMEGAT